jgi:uncharacterized damage-inducible protein DinB
MATTRRFLERVPENGHDWKPHEKSMSFGRLASHLAELPGWAAVTLLQDEFDVAPPGAPPYQPAVLATRRELLATFDQKAAAARAALVDASDELLGSSWTLKNGGRAVFTLPKLAVLRSFVLSHTIHHRAQLGVYFRLRGVPLPPTYGPTADESPL